MPIVFLDAVNETLKRAGIIQGDTQKLATSTVSSTATGLIATDAFTQSGIQQHIDLTIQLWNEVMHEAYSMGLFANEAASATLTWVSTSLTATTRIYAVPTDFERFAGADYHDRAIRGATTGLVLLEYPGGYARMRANQPIATDYIGDPSYWAINPVDGSLYLDRCLPTDLHGETYNFIYEKRLELTSTMATASMAFTDTAINALMPVVAEDFQRWRKDLFDLDARRKSLARAIGFLGRTQTRKRWGIRVIR